MPKVSVIVPNYNHAPYLEKRLKSIFQQSYQNFELIFLDDASTDSSVEIFTKFSDQRIRAFFNTTNSGTPFKQWNKGIALARGDYVWIAESDDFSEETFLEKLVDKLERYPDVGLVYCQSWKVDETERRLTNYVHWTDDLDDKRWNRDFRNDGRHECSHYLIMKNTLPNASAVLFRKSLYQDIGGAPEEMKFCGDWLLWAKMLLVSNIAFVSESLNYYREHRQTIRWTSSKDGLDLQEFFQVISFISSHVQVSPKYIEKTLNKYIEFWIQAAFQEDLSLQAHWRIYTSANKISYKVHQLLLMKLFTTWKARFHYKLKILMTREKSS